MKKKGAAHFLLIGFQCDSLLILIFSEVQLHNWFLQSQSDEENDFILGWAESSQFFQHLHSRESEWRSSGKRMLLLSDASGQVPFFHQQALFPLSSVWWLIKVTCSAETQEHVYCIKSSTKQWIFGEISFTSKNRNILWIKITQRNNSHIETSKTVSKTKM